MNRSKEIFRRALKRIPGGVNSPVRAWQAVGGQPLVIVRGKGSHIFDADGKRYIDFVGSWGPLILGHAHAKILAAVKRSVANGATFGAPTEGEAELSASTKRTVTGVSSSPCRS